MLCPKDYLIIQAQHRASGATIHRVNNVLAVYIGAAETLQMSPTDDIRGRCERAFREAEDQLTRFCISGIIPLHCEPSPT